MIAAVDIGGTKTLVAVFDNDGKIIEQTKFPTPKDYGQFKKLLADTVAKLSTDKFTFGVIGMRGRIDRLTGRSVYDDTLDWGQVNICEDCSKVFSCDFIIENDSKLAGLSEARLITDEFSKVLYVTVSTGIGTAFIINGELDQNTIDSEVGKSLFEHEGRMQQWEDFASGAAIVKKYHKRASEINDPAAWKAISKNISLGLVNALAAFTPQVVVFGGGVGSHFAKFIKPLKQAIIDMKPPEVTMPALRMAQRPEEAVIYGCYELAKQNRHEKSAT